jgi:ABC-type Fe3+/spermidine/putrescine transport system ATPase subunit
MSDDRYLVLDGLERRFGDVTAVAGVSLALRRGEVLALLGPSGSGKTTLLRMLAGFEQPDRGRVVLEGEDITRRPPEQRRFGMVFQHYALFPHLSVGDNVAFGLESLRFSRAEVARRVPQALALVDLAGYERRRVGELSGGQQQRVALARALAYEPRVLLLDEPLSNLDPALRERTRRELQDLIHRIGITTVLVTHEQDEAFDLGERVALLRAGRLEQVGDPAALYAAPATPFVASFIGRASRVPTTVVPAAPGVVRARVGTAWWDVPLPAGRSVPTQGPAVLYVRPEAVRLVVPGGGDVEGTVEGRRFAGALSTFLVRLDDGTTIEVQAPFILAVPGDRVALRPSRRAHGGLYLFAADE